MARSTPRLLSLIAARRAMTTRIGPVQFDLFVNEPSPAENTDIIGLAIVMPTPCPRCNGVAATIGTGRGPHSASLMCSCGRHLGWMSAQTFDFITEIVRRFGRPTEPIQVRVKNGSASLGA